MNIKLPHRKFGLVLAFSKKPDASKYSHVEFVFPNNKSLGSFGDTGTVDYTTREHDDSHCWVFVKVEGYHTQPRMNEFREMCWKEVGKKHLKNGIFPQLWKSDKWKSSELCMRMLGHEKFKVSAQKAFDIVIKNGGVVI